SGDRVRDGSSGGHHARCREPIGKGAMARTPARRHLRSARQLDLLLPSRDFHPDLDHPHTDLFLHRTTLSARGPRVSLTRVLLLLALTALASAFAGHALAADEIRVAIAEGLKSLEVGGGPMLLSHLAGQPLMEETPTWLRAVAREGAIELLGKRVAGVRLVPAGRTLFRFNNREYPGALEIVPTSDGLTLINELPLEEDLAGVGRAEAGERMPLEMLKAQAIVARTYAAYHRQLNAGKLYHVVASTANQQYLGRVPPNSPVWPAVRETQGQVLLWQGSLFPA